MQSTAEAKHSSGVIGLIDVDKTLLLGATHFNESLTKITFPPGSLNLPLIRALKAYSIRDISLFTLMEMSESFVRERAALCCLLQNKKLLSDALENKTVTVDLANPEHTQPDPEGVFKIRDIIIPASYGWECKVEDKIQEIRNQINKDIQPIEIEIERLRLIKSELMKKVVKDFEGFNLQTINRAIAIEEEKIEKAQLGEEKYRPIQQIIDDQETSPEHLGVAFKDIVAFWDSKERDEKKREAMIQKEDALRYLVDVRRHTEGFSHPKGIMYRYFLKHRPQGVNICIVCDDDGDALQSVRDAHHQARKQKKFGLVQQPLMLTTVLIDKRETSQRLARMRQEKFDRADHFVREERQQITYERALEPAFMQRFHPLLPTVNEVSHGAPFYSDHLPLMGDIPVNLGVDTDDEPIEYVRIISWNMQAPGAAISGFNAGEDASKFEARFDENIRALKKFIQIESDEKPAKIPDIIVLQEVRFPEKIGARLLEAGIPYNSLVHNTHRGLVIIYNTNRVKDLDLSPPSLPLESKGMSAKEQEGEATLFRDFRITFRLQTRVPSQQNPFIVLYNVHWDHQGCSAKAENYMSRLARREQAEWQQRMGQDEWQQLVEPYDINPMTLIVVGDTNHRCVIPGKRYLPTTVVPIGFREGLQGADWTDGFFYLGSKGFWCQPELSHMQTLDPEMGWVFQVPDQLFPEEFFTRMTNWQRQELNKPRPFICVTHFFQEYLREKLGDETYEYFQQLKSLGMHIGLSSGALLDEQPFLLNVQFLRVDDINRFHFDSLKKLAVTTDVFGTGMTVLSFEDRTLKDYKLPVIGDLFETETSDAKHTEKQENSDLKLFHSSVTALTTTSAKWKLSLGVAGVGASLSGGLILGGIMGGIAIGTIPVVGWGLVVLGTVCILSAGFLTLKDTNTSAGKMLKNYWQKLCCIVGRTDSGSDERAPSPSRKVIANSNHSEKSTSYRGPLKILVAPDGAVNAPPLLQTRAVAVREPISSVEKRVLDSDNGCDNSSNKNSSTMVVSL